MQARWVKTGAGEICRQQLTRGQVLQFAWWVPAIVAMEACGSARYWGRKMVELGHQAGLIAARFLRSFVKTNGTVAVDTQAILEAVQRPTLRFTAVKSRSQLAVLMLHRIRNQRLKMCTLAVNQLRALLYEYSVELLAGGRAALERSAEEMARPEAALPALANKTARTILTFLAQVRTYRKDYGRRPRRRLNNE